MWQERSEIFYWQMSHPWRLGTNIVLSGTSKFNPSVTSAVPWCLISFFKHRNNETTDFSLMILVQTLKLILDSSYYLLLTTFKTKLSNALNREDNRILATQEFWERYRAYKFHTCYFLRRMNILYNPNLVPVPVELYSHHPIEATGKRIWWWNSLNWKNCARYFPNIF